MVETTVLTESRNHCVRLFGRHSRSHKALLCLLYYFGIIPRPWNSSGSLILSSLPFVIPFETMAWQGKKANTNCMHFVIRQVFNPEFADLHWLFREPIMILWIFSKHMEMATCTGILYSSHEVNVTVKVSTSFNYIVIF